MCGVRKTVPLIFSGPCPYHNTGRGEGEGRLTSATPLVYIYDEHACPIVDFPILYRIVKHRTPIFVRRPEVDSRFNEYFHCRHISFPRLRQGSVEKIKTYLLPSTSKNTTHRDGGRPRVGYSRPKIGKNVATSQLVLFLGPPLPSFPPQSHTE